MKTTFTLNHTNCAIATLLLAFTLAVAQAQTYSIDPKSGG